MTLDPQLRALLDELQPPGVPGFAEMSIAEIREAVPGMAALNRPPVALTSVADRAIETRGGELRVRVFTPPGDGPFPVCVFFFGGGWVAGSPEVIDGPLRHLAEQAGTIVVCPEYRLAPEHPYPAALQDAVDAVLWTAGHAIELGANPARLAVGGESSGGALAAGAALVCRDAGGPPICHQLLIYPVLDTDFERPSYRANAEGYLLTRAAMQRFWKEYLHGSGQPDGLAAPLRTETVAGLPPTSLLVCGFDPLRDEGVEFARRLSAAGVSVSLEEFADLTHAVWYMDGALARGRVFADAAAAQLRDGFDVVAADEAVSR